MKYFGVASCPYCKKRVNLLRTWSLKRQGEYQCPRCSGISNIFLSPLIYVFALLAVFSGGAVYFFHKFILDDISLSTVGQVLIPFAVFFLLSLFMVHLEKPVIKKMTQAEIARKQRKERNQEQRRAQANAAPPRPAKQGGQMFYDSEEYLPRGEYHTGPLPSAEERVDLAKTSEVQLPKTATVQRSSSVQRPAPVQRSASPQRAPVEGRRQGPQTVGTQTVGTQTVGEQRVAPVRQRAASQPAAVAASQVVYPSGHTAVRSPAGVSRPVEARRPMEVSRPAAVSETPSRNVTHVDVPPVADDFFAKYDDPDYVARRLQEIQEKSD